jgi:hypothetical protein
LELAHIQSSEPKGAPSQKWPTIVMKAIWLLTFL